MLRIGMKIERKVLVYSGLVFPGAGYFFIERYKRALLAMALTMSCLVMLFIDVFYKASVLAQKIVYGEIPYDFFLIRQLIPTTPGFFEPLIVSAVYWVLVSTWLIGVVDSYRLAKNTVK